MTTTYLSLAISDTMFPANATLAKQALQPGDVPSHLINVVSALNPGHATTIDAIKRRYGFELPVPPIAPKVALVHGDNLLVIQAQFKRRLAEGERYSDEEVAAAPIGFSLYTVGEALLEPAKVKEIIGLALQVAKNQRGEERLQSPEAIRVKFFREIQELEAATDDLDRVSEVADLVYYAAQDYGHHGDAREFNAIVRYYASRVALSPEDVIVATLAKYRLRAARRDSKDFEAERRAIEDAL